MGIIDVMQAPSKDAAAIAEGVNRRTRMYTVKTDSTSDTVDTILVAAGLPVYDDAYDGDGTFGVTSRSACRSKKSRTLWEVTVVWTRKSRGGENPEENPLAEPATYSWGSRTVVEPIDQDINGKQFCNAAGERYDPPVTDEFRDSVLTVSLNVSVYNESQDQQWREKVNEDEYRGAAAGVALIDDITANHVGGGDLEYDRVTIRILFREDGWNRRILNCGFRELISITDDGMASYKVITDKAGRPLSQPSNLDAMGRVLAKGLPPIYDEYVTKKSKNFSTLGI